jgi:hypothetical protein
MSPLGHIVIPTILDFSVDIIVEPVDLSWSEWSECAIHSRFSAGLLPAADLHYSILRRYLLLYFFLDAPPDS